MPVCSSKGSTLGSNCCFALRWIQKSRHKGGHASVAWKNNTRRSQFDCTSTGINMLPISRGRCKSFSCKCEAIFYLRQHLFSLESLSWVLGRVLAVWHRMKICRCICWRGQMKSGVSRKAFHSARINQIVLSFKVSRMSKARWIYRLKTIWSQLESVSTGVCIILNFTNWNWSTPGSKFTCCSGTRPGLNRSAYCIYKRWMYSEESVVHNSTVCILFHANTFEESARVKDNFI